MFNVRPALWLTFTLLLAGLAACDKPPARQRPAPPPVPVRIATAQARDFPVELRTVGVAEAYTSIQVRSQATGELLRVHFAEGHNVARGALLFEVDPRPYQETLRQAEAAVERTRAQLRQAEAALARDQAQARHAEAEAARYAELDKAGVIARAQYDQFRTSAEVSRASVRASEAALETLRATLAADLAAVDRARLELSYCRIHAPIAGRAGTLLVHPGNLVRANSESPLIVLHQVTPIFVSFPVPEQHLAAIRRQSAARPLSVRVEGESSPPGRVTVIDNAVDRSTGTIRLKALFDNRNQALWPGQFLNLILTLETSRNATTVPAEAVQPGAEGPFAYVVKPDQTVEPRPVTPGHSAAGRTLIEKGLAPGEIVVTDGHLRLYPGARVRTDIAPEALPR